MADAVEFDVTVEREPGARVVRIVGELDLATTPQFASAVGSAEPDRLVVDLGECTFLDSSAIRALLQAARAQRDAGGTAVVATTQPAILRVLEIAGVGDALPVFATAREAL